MKKFVLFVVLLAAVICCVACARYHHIHEINEAMLKGRPRPCSCGPLGKDWPDVEDYKLTPTALLPEQLYFTEYRKDED